jgi:aldehyde dehydrogenase (NAD+)
MRVFGVEGGTMFGDVLKRLGIEEGQSGAFADDWIRAPGGETIESINPATGETLGRVVAASRDDYERVVAASQQAFLAWRTIPPPVRGEFVRRLGEALRRYQDDLGLLVTLEVGKIRSEGRGEVQEMIDMCDFAVGLSRQLYGLTIASERPLHSMLEQWHPLGPVGVITAFNFPVAVWAWNAALAAVCGDTCVWKPSQLTPLTAIAVQKIAVQVARELDVPCVFQLVIGGSDAGRWLADDERLLLISATGSCAMGRSVAAAVGKRLGRSLLELGGNNAAIISDSASLDRALRAVAFAAVGTAGQRCTSLRRLILHESIAEAFIERLAGVFRSVKIGLPWEEGTLVGPLIRRQAVDAMLNSLVRAKSEGGEIVAGGRALDGPGFFVEPTIVRSSPDMAIVGEETFAPILYAVGYREFDEAIAIQNGVEQGLSSAIFTERFGEAMRFLAGTGSDCGIANVNIGTSGAEIGGAFGGEKASGGGREAGSDAWKTYMRRQTCTLNFGQTLPLAQGVRFDV